MYAGRSKRQVRPVPFTNSRLVSHPRTQGSLSTGLVPRPGYQGRIFIQRIADRGIADTMGVGRNDLSFFADRVYFGLVSWRTQGTLGLLAGNLRGYSSVTKIVV